METGESIKPPATEQQEEPVGDKKPVKVRCVLLYDGTGNNKTNINSRLAKDEFYEKSKSLWSKIKGGNDSYENFFTNIASLDVYMLDQQAEGFDITVIIYTEGAGTRDNQTDKLEGYGMGIGEAGIKNKCDSGIIKAITAILAKEYEGAPLNPDKYYFAQLHFDVFGFSRGAATARYAIYKLLLEEEKTIKDKLRLHGFDVKEAKVRFAGLFDTVSSHGTSFKDDVEKLHLKAVSEADFAVQLSAADEYRKTFSLTNIDSAVKNGGIEYFMPGAHSDVGGSYHDLYDKEKDPESAKGNGTEDFILYSGIPNEVKQDARQLIAEGWYTLNEQVQEIEYEEIYNDFGQPVHAYIKANRIGISNAYCRIPLKVMAEESKKQKVPINHKTLEQDSNKIINKYIELTELDKNVYQYIVKDMSQYNRCAPLLRKIRNKHLHMSAKEKLGMGPRFEGNGNSRLRKRGVHEG